MNTKNELIELEKKIQELNPIFTHEIITLLCDYFATKRMNDILSISNELDVNSNLKELIAKQFR